MDRSFLASVRAEALFVSDVQPSDHPGPAQVRAAVLRTVGRYRAAGCAARVAQEYGEHPVEAALRMRWAAATVRAAYRADGRRWTVPRRSTEPPGVPARAAPV